MQIPAIPTLLLAAALASCAGQTESVDSSAQSPSGVAPEVTAPAPEVDEQATEEPAADATGWAAGDTIPSGTPGVPDIQILEVRANGTGDPVGTGREATLAYKAMKADGQVLDPGTRPFTFLVGGGRAIKGWDVVVARMRVGDDFTILLPQQLAYGPAQGDLKFDMKLLSVR